MNAAALASSSGMSLADMIVAAGVLLAVAMLFFPAIANSRFQARVAACQHNLSLLGRSLINYSDAHQGYFPLTPSEGPEAGPGYYTVVLRENHLIDDPATFICPAELLASGESPYVPTPEDFVDAEGLRLETLRRRLGGSYGYTLGVDRNGEVEPVRNRSRGTFAIMADAPSLNSRGWQSFNHGGHGQNVLFEDGAVRFIRTPHSHGQAFFLSDRGYVEPGRNIHDAVIATSDPTPIVLMGER